MNQWVVSVTMRWWHRAGPDRNETVVQFWNPSSLTFPIKMREEAALFRMKFWVSAGSKTGTRRVKP